MYFVKQENDIFGQTNRQTFLSLDRQPNDIGSEIEKTINVYINTTVQKEMREQNLISLSFQNKNIDELSGKNMSIARNGQCYRDSSELI